AMIGDWPGSLGLIADPAVSAVADRFDVALYPTGPGGLRRVYSGSHSFAIAKACQDVDAALTLLRDLTSFDAQLAEAQHGAVPARSDAADRNRELTTSPLARRIQDLQAETIATSMISFPPLAWYPLLEEIVWPTLAAVLRDELSVNDAIEQAQSTLDADPRITTPEALPHA
ncbi:MAG TPA: hypothetical protein VFQ54_06545, partial [Thermomicrobiales bacterium]|nr:hypothetical protein [Thermomicrobiales bacterium]